MLTARRISHLSVPPQNHSFVISQILGDTHDQAQPGSHSLVPWGRVGENPGNEIVVIFPSHHHISIVFPHLFEKDNETLLLSNFESQAS